MIPLPTTCTKSWPSGSAPTRSVSRQAHSAKATKLALQRPQLQLEHPLAIESAADSSWLHNTHVRMSGGFIVFMPYNRLFEAATRVTLQQYADLGDDIIDETVTEVPIYANVHGYWPIVHGNAACPNLWDLKLKLYAGSSTFPAWSKLGCTWGAPEGGKRTACIAGRKRNLRQASLRQHPIARNLDSSCCSTQRPGRISSRRKLLSFRILINLTMGASYECSGRDSSCCAMEDQPETKNGFGQTAERRRT